MEQRTGDLVLPQGTYVLLQDGASGQVDVITGPSKLSLADTDKPVVYESESGRFTITPPDRAIRVCPAADEGQYIVLVNPSLEKEGKNHPAKGKQPADGLNAGRRINIQGPDTFALFPGQIANVIDGHQLKFNEYLIVRIYNEEAAKENLKNAVVKVAEGDEGSTEPKDKKKNLFDTKDIRTGNLLIIKGTDVSFYIPPTGIEIVEESGSYTRNAVTLERLEYCILLDQNGNKRYVEGPDVVFPKPSESFIVNNKQERIFKSIELNENMGLYIKVIADYEDGDKSYKTGDEIFLTGTDQKIYYPRAEHAIIKYGDESIYYATAVPKGEGRYVLDKITGDISLTKGPKMLLPDPRKEVIVKRVLDDKSVSLWFPGNREALAYNKNLSASMDYSPDFSNRSRSFYNSSSAALSADVVGDMMDEMDRKSTYTKPRTIQLDTKFEGAVSINVWPNYAVQIVNKTGDRKVIEGPKVFMLDYDESLEVLAFSTGKPKTDHDLMKSVYLQTKNNVVSDLITVETKDLINVDVRLSYKVDFGGDSKKWFGVSDYVKLLSQHMRSVIRNAVKKITIEAFNDDSTDIIRDTILGAQTSGGKRAGKKFDENGMIIYDIEVLNIKIGDHTIADMLIGTQHDIVEQNLKINQLTKDLSYTKKIEELNRAKLDEKQKTSDKQFEVRSKDLDNNNNLDKKADAIKAVIASTKVKNDLSLQESFNTLASQRLAREKAKDDQDIMSLKEKTDIRVGAIEKELAAIQPGLIEAMITSGNVKFADSLAKNLKSQRGGLGDLFSGGGFDEILKTIKGSPLEKQFAGIISSYSELKDNVSKKTE